MLRLPPREILTTVHVGIVIVGVELLVRLVPLPRLGRLLGVRLDLHPAVAAGELLHWEELPSSARRQLRCTWRVAHSWPFSIGPCLRRALVAGRLLRRFDPAVRLGLIGAGGVHLAHAWLEIDGRPLEDVEGYTVFTVGPAGPDRRAAAS